MKHTTCRAAGIKKDYLLYIPEKRRGKSEQMKQEKKSKRKKEKKKKQREGKRNTKEKHIILHIYSDVNIFLLRNSDVNMELWIMEQLLVDL